MSSAVMTTFLIAARLTTFGTPRAKTIDTGSQEALSRPPVPGLVRTQATQVASLRPAVVARSRCRPSAGRR